MESLPYRATVFLRQADVHTMGCGGGRPADCEGAERQPLEGQPGSLDLMERSFAKEADAVLWCNVMSEAEPQATGAWFVAVSRGGRMMRITREAELSPALGSSPIDGGIGGGRDDLVNVLATAGLHPASTHAARTVRLEPVGSA